MVIFKHDRNRDDDVFNEPNQQLKRSWLN